MFVGVLCKSVIVVLGFLLVCKAQEEYPYPIQTNLLYNKLDAEYGSILQCYDCNSEYDPRCGDPFNPYTIGMINCTDRNTPEHLLDPDDPEKKLRPTLCRKIVQRVEGKTRVIRGCGYIKDSHDDKQCFRRTGTKNVEVIHCSCTKSLCNAANTTKRSLENLVGLFSILIMYNALYRRLSF
ncbi:uncharacterized protein LOC114336851 [Diabrotica virgifera virgifera]|uniref:Uncharacterized protein LOC114336851 n=1 Tax=Diabrotica virgifera virgifera TaxID=50390 RepID=A0A6P7GGI8_DIAVI|nr:uncharacterized protein LOC114336851 [Diabrotica virgifera virgifera]